MHSVKNMRIKNVKRKKKINKCKKRTTVRKTNGVADVSNNDIAIITIALFAVAIATFSEALVQI